MRRERTAADAGGGDEQFPRFHRGGGCIARDRGGDFFD